MLRLEEIKVSPMETIDSLKFYAEKRIPFFKGGDELMKTEVEEKGKMTLLDKLIIETLYQTGIRKLNYVTFY
jgi:integrase/recombinase XerC